MVLVGLLAPALATAADAAERLSRMAEAMRMQAYEGTLVYAHGQELDALSLVHGAIDGVEHERLRTLSGASFEVIRMGDEVTCIWPASKRVMISQRPGDILPPKPPRGLDELPSPYSASTEGGARMAGRDADVIHVAPRDRYRYGYRIWIDRGSDLLLRSDLLSQDGKAVEQLMFTRLEPLDSVVKAAFEPTLEGMEYMEHGGGGGGGSIESPAWRVTDLPPGFRNVAHKREAMPPRGEAVQHSVYTDGLASVSVFIEPLGEQDDMPLKGASRMGAVHAYGMMDNDHQITVVGEVPGATVKRIARSVERVRE
jgi:sigma-E factor negative regulatory protein RseB